MQYTLCSRKFFPPLERRLNFQQNAYKFPPHLNGVATLPCEMHHSLLLYCQYVPYHNKGSTDTASVHRHIKHTTGMLIHAIDDGTDSVCHQTEVGSV